MIALYIPMQPSSKMPMIARRRRRSAAISFATFFARAGRGRGIEFVDVGEIVRHTALGQPLMQLLLERLVGESLAPQRAVLLARLGQRAVEIEHADQARPLARPVGDGQDRRAMGEEPGQNVVGVLPHRLGDDDRRLRVDLGEHLEALLLAGDEAVLERRVVGMGALDLDAELRERGRDLLLHRLLRRPARFVGALA